MPGDIGPAVLPQLNNEAVRAYRLSYRKFRGGGSRGTKGEDPEVCIVLAFYPPAILRLPLDRPREQFLTFLVN